LRIDCPWKTEGEARSFSFAVKLEDHIDGIKLIEDRLRYWWPGFKAERHEDSSGNPNIYYYPNQHSFNECHNHGATMNTQDHVIRAVLDGRFLKLFVWTIKGIPMNIVDDLIRHLHTKIAQKPRATPIQPL
jgi:hypothetical protein